MRSVHTALTYIVVPGVVNLVVVGEASLHDVEAVAVARLDVRKALTGGAGGHLLERRQAGGGGSDLQHDRTENCRQISQVLNLVFTSKHLDKTQKLPQPKSHYCKHKILFYSY